MTDGWSRVLREPRSIGAREQLLLEWKRDGDPRAGFLELQLHGFLDIYRGAEFAEDGGDMLNRAERLLYRAGNAAFAGPIAALTDKYSYELGLVGHAGVSATEFRDRAASFIAAAPLVSLGIVDPADAREVMGVQAFGQMLSLNLHGRGVDDLTATAIAASPYVRELRTLSFYGGELTHRGLAALTESKNLPNLISLDVTGNPCASAVNEVDGRHYWIGPAGGAYWEQAFADQLHGSASWVVPGLVWPPVFDTYAWID